MKLRNKYVLGAVAVLALSASCTGRFEMLNTNPNQVTSDQLEAKNYRVGSKVVTLQGLVIPIEEHMYQFNESLSGGPFAGYTGSAEIWEQSFETFNPSSDWRKWPFSQVITEMYTPYRGIINGTDDEVANAFATLLRVAIMMRVTDAYGPIPYSDAVNNESIYVKYDSQKDVYAKMFEEVDSAIAAFENNSGLSAASWSAYDRVYYGNISQWIMYANSLKLRMAMRISYADEALAKEKAQEAIDGGLILSNSDNAYMHPSENRFTLIYNDWKDSRVGADILCYMTGYNDPRLSKMFIANEKGNYAGIRLGASIDKKETAVSSYSNLVVASDDPILWLNAAEVSFLLAEYHLRFNNDFNTARTYYEQGITLSFEEWGASGAADYITGKDSEGKDLLPAVYTDPRGKDSYSGRMSECKIGWDASGDVETNLEQIITQKWIAMFPLGTEMWSEYRRTGYPKLMPALRNLGPDNVDMTHRARRLTYPVEEYQSNDANLSEAIGILNSEAVNGYSTGDAMSTRVWWDRKDYSLSD